MNEEQRWNFILELDDKLLRGGVVLSEWCSFIVRETDLAFVGGAHLATIVTAMAGIESYLRSEYSEGRRSALYDLVEQSPLEESLKRDIHALRKYTKSVGSRVRSWRWSGFTWAPTKIWART